MIRHVTAQKGWRRIDSASKVLARALADTKSYVEMFRDGDRTERIASLELLFGLNLYFAELNCPESLYFHYDDDDGGAVAATADAPRSLGSGTDPDTDSVDSTLAVKSFYMMTPEWATHFPIWQTVYLAGEILCRFGVATTNRIIKAALWFDKHTNEVMAGVDKYFALQRMGVDVEHQGKGIGTCHLKQCLLHADKLALPIMLSTQDPKNLTFYGKV